MRFRLSSTAPKAPKTLMKATLTAAFCLMVFMSLRVIHTNVVLSFSSPSVLSTRNGAFSKRCVFKIETFEIVFVILRVGRFQIVDDRQKRIKKYVFSNENALAWMGPNPITP